MKKYLLLFSIFFGLASCEKENATDPVTNPNPKDSTITTPTEKSDTTQLMPLAVGNEWTYEETNTPPGRVFTLKITEKKNILWHDRTGAPSFGTQVTYCTNTNLYFYKIADGVAVGGYNKAGDKITRYFTIFKDPTNQREIGVDTRYGYGESEYKWRGGKYMNTTLNGVWYDGVWDQYTTNGSVNWYVRGVGPIYISDINIFDGLGKIYTATILEYKLVK